MCIVNEVCLITNYTCSHTYTHTHTTTICYTFNWPLVHCQSEFSVLYVSIMSNHFVSIKNVMFSNQNSEILYFIF